MSDLAATIRDHWKNLGLRELKVIESLGGQQAIAKYEDIITGPWGVGCDPDPVTAIERALAKGAAIRSPSSPASDTDDLLV